MAGAILQRWIECGLSAARVSVVDPGRSDPPAAGVTLLSALPSGLDEGTVVVLGVKPQALPAVASALSQLLREGHVVVSMLAGVTLEQLRISLGDDADLVRIMPNLPVALGKGVCALYAGTRTRAEAVLSAERLLQPLGLVEKLADESQFNLLTAISGCGPAFVFRFIDALAKAAVGLGFEAAQAARLAMATVEGSSALAAMADEPPADLADKVASKGGMTREGLDVLDADGRLETLLIDTLRAARDRGEELNRLSS